MSPMKKLCLILIALACVPVLASGQVVEEIVARVNTQIITRSEFSRSKDQLGTRSSSRTPMKQTRYMAPRKRMFCATSSTSNFFSTKAKISGLPATPTW